MFHRMEKTQEAIRQNDAGQVKKIGNTKKYAEACALAIESNAPDALRALLKSGKGFYFSGSGYHDNAAAAHRLLDAAYASSNAAPLLSVFYEANKTAGYGKLDTEDFLRKETPAEILQDILKNNSSLYNACMDKAGVYSTESLRVVLDCSPDNANAQVTNDKALAMVAEMGNVDGVTMLLRHHANPDYRSGEALLCAAEKGHQDMVDLLLPLTNPCFFPTIAWQLRQMPGVEPSIIAAIEPAATQEPAAAPPQEGANGFIREDDDTLSRKQTMADGTRVRDLFNFLTKQQLSIVEIPGCPNPGVTTTPFSKLEDGVVEKMQKIHADLGEKEKPAASAPKTALRLN